MELFTMSAAYIGLLFGTFVAVKCIILPGLNNRFGQDTPRQVILPTNTPRGIAENDCLLGATATLTHLVNRRNEVRPLALPHVHLSAREVLQDMGFTSKWGDFLKTVDGHGQMSVWEVLRQRLGLPETTEVPYEHNPHLRGVGMLFMTGPTNGHAVTYAYGMISDSARPADIDSWETLDEVLRRCPTLRPATLHRIG